MRLYVRYYGSLDYGPPRSERHRFCTTSGRRTPIYTIPRAHALLLPVKFNMAAAAILNFCLHKPYLRIGISSFNTLFAVKSLEGVTLTLLHIYMVNSGREYAFSSQTAENLNAL